MRPAWVGLDVQRISPPLAEKYGWDRDYGVIVSGVEAGSPAEKAGIRRGDLIADVGGSAVRDDEDFGARMRSYPARTSITLSLWREGKQMPLSFATVEFPASLAAALDWDRLGLRFEAASGAMVVSQVRPGFPAARAGLARGDVLVRLNNEPVSSAADLRDTLVAARTSQSVALLVRRGRFLYNLTLPFQRG